MLTLEEFEKLGKRVAKGREWFLSNGGFNNPTHKDVFVIWNQLAAKWLKEARQHGAIAPILTQHSSSWHEVKMQEAYYKWKRTVKAKRGPDPRTLPKESFI